MEQKRYSLGIGRLDAQQLNDISRMAYQQMQQAPAWAPAAWMGPYMAIINPPSGTAAQVLAGGATPYKWGYDFVIVDPTDNADLATANSASYTSLGTGAGDSPTALNLYELNNSATVQMGVQVSNLPSGITLQPVPSTTHVMLWLAPMPYVDENSTTPGEPGWVAYFHYPNQFDGECP